MISSSPISFSTPGSRLRHVTTVFVTVVVVSLANWDDPRHEPKNPPILAFAGKAYRGQIRGVAGAKLVEGPVGMTVTGTGTITWMPTHGDAPYVDVAIETGQGQTVRYTIHVIGIPETVARKMKDVNAQFTGVDHSFAAYGDSITYASAWILDLASRPSQALAPAWNKHSGYFFIDRGFNHASGYGWTSAVPLGTKWGEETVQPSIIEHALENDRPEVATVMFGTNDCGQREPVEQVKENLAYILEKVMKAGSIPILCVPSRRGWGDSDMTPYIDAVRDLGREKEVPLLDIDMLFENEGAPNMFWAMGNPHPKFNTKGSKVDDYDVKTGYGVINRGIYHMYRYLIELDIIDAPDLPSVEINLSRAQKIPGPT